MFKSKYAVCLFLYLIKNINCSLFPRRKSYKIAYTNSKIASRAPTGRSVLVFSLPSYHANHAYAVYTSEINNKTLNDQSCHHEEEEISLLNSILKNNHHHHSSSSPYPQIDRRFSFLFFHLSLKYFIKFVLQSIPLLFHLHRPSIAMFHSRASTQRGQPVV